MIELQTSVKQDDTTRTRTPKPGILTLMSREWAGNKQESKRNDFKAFRQLCV